MTQEVAFARAVSIELPDIKDLSIALTRDRVLIKPKEAPKQSKGGILLPDDAVRRPQYGLVVAVGPQVESSDLIKPGVLVVFPQYVGLEIKLTVNDEEQTYLVMEEKNILGILRGNEESRNE